MAIAMDDSFRDGYQPFSRQTFSPLQQPYQFSSSFTGKPSSSAPSDAKPSIPNQPATMSPAPAQGPSLAGQNPAGTAGYQTFSQMQAAGVPRPAPPMAPPTGSSPQSPLGGAIQGAVLGGLQNPSAYNSDEVMRSFGRMSQDIDDQYAQETGHTNELMAQRGLYDSTEAAGRLHDLNVGRRSARTDLAQNLLTQQAQTYGQDRAAAIAAALGLSSQQNQSGQFAQDLDYRTVGRDQQYTLGQNQNLLALLNGLGAAGYLGEGQDVNTLMAQLGGMGGGLGGAMGGGAMGQAGGGGQYLGQSPQAGGGGYVGDLIPMNQPQFAPSTAPASGAGGGYGGAGAGGYQSLTAGTSGQRPGEATVINSTGDSSGLNGPVGDTLGQAQALTAQYQAQNPQWQSQADQYVIQRYYGGDRSPLIMQQMQELQSRTGRDPYNGWTF